MLFSLTPTFLKDHASQLLSILDIRTDFKPTETFQYTHFSICHPLNTKKGLYQGEVLRPLLRTLNSVKENFENFKRDFQQRLLYKRGYPVTLVKNILSEV